MISVWIFTPAQVQVSGCSFRDVKKFTPEHVSDSKDVYLNDLGSDIVGQCESVSVNFTLTPRILSMSWFLVPLRGWSSVWGGGETSGPDSAGSGSLIASPPPNLEATGASGTSTDGGPGLPPPTVSTWRWWFWSIWFRLNWALNHPWLWLAHRDTNNLLNPWNSTRTVYLPVGSFFNKHTVFVRSVFKRLETRTRLWSPAVVRQIFNYLTLTSGSLQIRKHVTVYLNHSAASSRLCLCFLCRTTSPTESTWSLLSPDQHQRPKPGCRSVFQHVRAPLLFIQKLCHRMELSGYSSGRHSVPGLSPLLHVTPCLLTLSDEGKIPRSLWFKKCLCLLEQLRQHLRRGRFGASKGRSRSRRDVPTRKQLDAQLDEYMSLSKSRLDQQLDDYMSMSRQRLDAELDEYMSMAGETELSWNWDAELGGGFI